MGSASDNSDSVVCHTDLQSCCYGHHPVDWYYPGGEIDCHSLLEKVIEFRELSYAVAVVLLDQLVSIAVILQLLLSIMKPISQ